MYICVWINLYMHISVKRFVDVCMSIHLHVHMCMHAFIYMYVCMCSHVHILYMFVYVSMCVQVPIHAVNNHWLKPPLHPCLLQIGRTHRTLHV